MARLTHRVSFLPLVISGVCCETSDPAGPELQSTAGCAVLGEWLVQQLLKGETTGVCVSLHIVRARSNERSFTSHTKPSFRVLLNSPHRKRNVKEEDSSLFQLSDIEQKISPLLR